MARQSKHYRVAKREVATKPIPANGVFIKKSHRPIIIAGIVVGGLFLFINGILIGYLCGKKRRYFG